MRSAFAGIEIGKTALVVSQLGLDVTGHNIANVDTTGYTRQRIVQTAYDPFWNVGRVAPAELAKIGGGVNIKVLDQIRSAYLDRRFRTENTLNAYWQKRTEGLRYVESYFDDYAKETSVNYAIAEFFKAFKILAEDPVEGAQRTLMRDAGTYLTQQLNSIYDGLTELQSLQNDAVKTTVDEINTIASEIVELNKSIYGYEATGFIANDLRDKRNLLIDELALIIPVEYREESFPIGSGMTKLIVEIGGEVLVDHDKQYKLTVKEETKMIPDATVVWTPIWEDRTFVDSNSAYTVYIGNTGVPATLSGIDLTDEWAVKNRIDRINEIAKEFNKLYATMINDGGTAQSIPPSVLYTAGMFADNAAKAIDEITATINGINTGMTGIDALIASANAAIASANARIASDNADIASANASITSISDSITSINDSITSIGTNITSIETNITSIETNITSIEDDITSIEDDIDDINDKIAFEIANTNDSIRIAELQDELQAAQDDLQAAQDNLQAAQDDLQAAKDDLQAAKDDLQAAQDALPLAQAALLAAQAALQAAQDDLPLAQAALLTAQNDLQTAQASMQSTQGVLRTAQTALSEAEKAKKDAKKADELIAELNSYLVGSNVIYIKDCDPVGHHAEIEIAGMIFARSAGCNDDAKATVKFGYSAPSGTHKSGDPLDVTGGELLAYMQMRDNLDVDVQGIPYYIDLLNDIARSLVTFINEQHRAGWTDPPEGNSLTGINFFYEGYPDYYIKGTQIFIYDEISDSYVDTSSSDSIKYNSTALQWEDGSGNPIANFSTDYKQVTGVDQVNAKNIRLSDEVIDSVFNIACSSVEIVKHGAPEKLQRGNNENMNALYKLFEKNDFAITVTNGAGVTKTVSIGSFDGFATKLRFDLASALSASKKTADNTNIVLKAVENQRLSVSGVSLDEEMTNLVKYQHSYSGASRVITAMDEALDVLINRTGRVGL